MIKVKITVDKDKREATVDFTGTSSQQGTNFNAPEPVTRAAVLYVFRVMVDDDIPMNAGCLRPINIVIPPGSMLTPQYPAAVVAGNVEVSQAVTDCLFGALGAMAAAQGTMNNLNFGNAPISITRRSARARRPARLPGTDAVHTHMTNTRLTDPEVLEFRYPVLLEDFHIRKGSGGRGKWSAGDGVRRTIRFLERMDCTILSGHRRVRPFGLAGGESGQVGENSVRRKDGRIEKLEGCDATVIDAGEAVIIQTPTAGGYGEPGVRLTAEQAPPPRAALAPIGVVPVLPETVAGTPDQGGPNSRMRPAASSALRCRGAAATARRPPTARPRGGAAACIRGVVRRRNMRAPFPVVLGWCDTIITRSFERAACPALRYRGPRRAQWQDRLRPGH